MHLVEQMLLTAASPGEGLTAFEYAAWSQQREPSATLDDETMDAAAARAGPAAAEEIKSSRLGHEEL